VPYNVVGEVSWWNMLDWVWSVGIVDEWADRISHKEGVDSCCEYVSVVDPTGML
jgi:hypothetical protein